MTRPANGLPLYRLLCDLLTRQIFNREQEEAPGEGLFVSGVPGCLVYGVTVDWQHDFMQLIPLLLFSRQHHHQVAIRRSRSSAASAWGRRPRSSECLGLGDTKSHKVGKGFLLPFFSGPEKPARWVWVRTRSGRGIWWYIHDLIIRPLNWSRAL